jgi:hypothetical protein
VQVEPAIALSSPLAIVQYPETKLSMVTPKVVVQTSSHAKMAQLSETCQSPYIRSESFNHSKSISAINEYTNREILEGSITSLHLDFGNENLPPSQSSVEKVCDQEFDLEGRKRKLQQFLASTVDRPAKHTKTLARESWERGEKHQKHNPDWSKVT